MLPSIFVISILFDIISEDSLKILSFCNNLNILSLLDILYVPTITDIVMLTLFNTKILPLKHQIFAFNLPTLEANITGFIFLFSRKYI